MFWYIAIIWICTIIYTNGLTIKDTFNVLMKDDANYKVDLLITTDDLEMISKKEQKRFKIHKGGSKLIELNEMARNVSLRAMDQRVLKINTTDLKDAYASILPLIVIPSNYEIPVTTYTGALTTIKISSRKNVKKELEEIEYDYESLVNEYYDEATNEAESENAYHIRKSVIDLSGSSVLNSLMSLFTVTIGSINCTEVTGIGPSAFRCLIEDFVDERQPTGALVARFWKMSLIWLLVYLVIAIPLWCTRGWCCCFCLFCKFFKPQRTIEEAKKYVIQYPPGIYKTKKGEEIRYEPTEREKECYEEFEHFIKTL